MLMLPTRHQAARAAHSAALQVRQDWRLHANRRYAGRHQLCYPDL